MWSIIFAVSLRLVVSVEQYSASDFDIVSVSLSRDDVYFVASYLSMYTEHLSDLFYLASSKFSP